MADSLFNASALYQLLLNNQMTPRLIDADPFGQYGSGLFDPSTNVVVARDPTKTMNTAIQKSREDTLAHEFTHAAQLNLLEPVVNLIKSRISSKQKISREEQQFVDAIDKLMTKNESWKNFISRLYTPTGDSKADTYRTDPLELQAWGVGYMSRPYNKYDKEKSNINPHMNPSMASEFSILSELYSKLPKSIRESALSSRTEEIKKGRKKDLVDLYKESSDIFSDPFAPTIR